MFATAVTTTAATTAPTIETATSTTFNANVAVSALPQRVPFHTHEPTTHQVRNASMVLTVGGSAQNNEKVIDAYDYYWNHNLPCVNKQHICFCHQPPYDLEKTISCPFTVGVSSDVTSIPPVRPRTALQLLRKNQARRILQGMGLCLLIRRKKQTSASCSGRKIGDISLTCSQPLNVVGNCGGGGGIVEISGEGGTGKTQICLGLLVSAVLPGEITSAVDGSMFSLLTLSKQRRTSPKLPTTPTKGTMHIQNPYASTRKRKFPSEASSSSSSPNDDFRHSRRNGLRYQRSIYISMGEGGSGPGNVSTRIRQIAATRMQLYRQNNYDDVVKEELQVKEIMKRILLKKIRNVEELIQFAREELPALLQVSNRRSAKEGEENSGVSNERIGLIVLDSMGGLFRHDQDDQIGSTGISHSYYIQRSKVLFELSSHFKKMSDLHDVPFVVVNQVSVNLSKKSASISSSVGSSAVAAVTPALGLCWSNCVNTRYLVTRSEVNQVMNVSTTGDRSAGSCAVCPRTSKNDTVTTTGETRKFKRTLHVLLSSSLPPITTPFVIGPEGARVQDT